MQTATILQRLLTEEGAFFHPVIRLASIPSMGGGYGVVAAESLKPGTLLAKIPRNSMITASKARRYLASFEFKQRQALSCSNRLSNESFSVVDLEGVEQELSQSLSPANTIICYLLLNAVQYGRFSTPHAQNGMDMSADSSSKTDKISFQSDHVWMKTWILSLPALYNNLLELRPEHGDEECYSISEDVEKITSSSDAYLRPYLQFERHRHKVLREQANVEAEFQLCKSVLSFLQTMPHSNGEERSMPVTVEQFLWAYNTLMTRGFAYDPEVWSLMPWVDYFNHALTSNATMKYDERRRAYIFEALFPIETGEQIFLPYGAYTDMELLLWYGFTLTPVLLPEVANVRTVKERSQKLRMLLREGLEIMDDGDISFANRDELWLKTVNRALGYCFSPWTDADGSYPSNLRESWLELLLSSYLKIYNESSSHGEIYQFPPAAEAANALARLIMGTQTRHKLPSKLTARDCRLGALGPSSSMLRLLKHIRHISFTHNEGKQLSLVDILRAICWAELFCNYGAGMTSFLLKGETVKSPDGTVKSMAHQASLDAASLLHLLAVEATEEELRVYLSRMCD
ncbi:hypothetical protein MOQ_008884 [Trypanosoma cruzi marinkellei]|uniref:SET domain-containing protein n=1 Tax=Trypanosoma cruzi marinkellei TaxID=85056 RepID=K2MYG6_TRYCR|nr:hypothetical protein MOQ_008884 [Trypanosoma cruzi marinkellei]